MEIRNFRARARTSLSVVILTCSSSAQEVLYRFEGDHLSQLGRADEVGDLNGDGVPDLALIEDLGSFTGQLILVSGADGSTLAQLVGPEYSMALPRVRGAGDFDGDGIEDILVSQPVEPLPLDCDGRVLVISGATLQPIVEFLGPEGEEQEIGRSIAGVGDVDQDGYSDILYIGFRGPARLHFGPDGSRVRMHPSISFDVSVAAIGDINADGHPDYGVGSPHYIVSGLGNAGAMDLYSGVDGALLHSIVGTSSQGFLGVAAAPSGDLDGDGYGDVLISTYRANGALGYVRAYSGLDASVLWESMPPGTMTFGTGMAGGKDFTGDGVWDWVIGAPQTQSPAGTYPGAIFLFDGASKTLLWKRYGEAEPVGSMGRFVFLAEDMNGDGIAEVGYGDVQADPNGLSNAGVLTVLAGAPGYANKYCSSEPNSTGRRAKMFLEGPISVGNNELALNVEDAVPGVFGLFFYGTDPRQTAFGDGVRCVGGRTQRLFPPRSVGADGTLARPLDFTLPPVASGGANGIASGATRYFQFWFRDPDGSGGTGLQPVRRDRDPVHALAARSHRGFVTHRASGRDLRSVVFP